MKYIQEYVININNTVINLIINLITLLTLLYSGVYSGCIQDIHISSQSLYHLESQYSQETCLSSIFSRTPMSIWRKSNTVNVLGSVQ